MVPLACFVPAFGAEVEVEAGTPLADSLEKAGVWLLLPVAVGFVVLQVQSNQRFSGIKQPRDFDGRMIEQGYVLACSEYDSVRCWGWAVTDVK